MSHSHVIDTLDRTVGDRRHVVTVELAITPTDIASAGGSCESAFTEDVEGLLSADVKEAVENGVQSSYLQGTTQQACRLVRRTRMCVFTSCVSAARTRTWLPSDGRVCTDQECQDGSRNISCYGVRLHVPLHDKGKYLTSCCYRRWDYNGVLDAGSAAGRGPGPGAHDVPGGDCGGGAPQPRVGRLGSETGDCQRYPESP